MRDNHLTQSQVAQAEGRLSAARAFLLRSLEEITAEVERRFRDIHTVSQQLQGRQEHFETVGQYLLGLEPGSLMWL